MILVIIIGIALTFQLIIIPYTNKKSAAQVVFYILDHWKEKDILVTIDYWQDPNTFPPVSYIESYKIAWQRFYRLEKQSYVETYVKIDFGQGSSLKDGKEWLFKLTNTTTGWRVVAFKPSHLRGQRYTPPKHVYNPQADWEILQRLQNEPNYQEPLHREIQNFDRPPTKTTPPTTVRSEPILKPFVEPTIDSTMEMNEEEFSSDYRTIPATLP